MSFDSKKNIKEEKVQEKVQEEERDPEREVCSKLAKIINIIILK